MSGKISEMTVTELRSGTAVYAALASGGQNYRADLSMAALGVTARAALAAISSPTAGTVRTLLEADREGLFVFAAADLSAQVAADPQQGIYIAPASDATGASGAWVRKFTGPVAPEWFGAMGDGATNDYTAINAAVTFLVAVGGGAVRFRNVTYRLNSTLAWSGAPIILEGAGGNIQSAGTILYFPNSVSQTGCVNPKNGALGKGSGSAVRNLIIKGGDGSAVSAANAKAGLGSGLLVQCPGSFESVTAMNCEGNGIYAMSAYPGADVSINCNGAHFLNCWAYNCGNNGRATYGVDANMIVFSGGSSVNCDQFGDYWNAVLGTVSDGALLEGNAVGAIRIGDVSGYNRVTAAYVEQSVNLMLQMDAGGAGQNNVEFIQASVPGSPSVTDNTGGASSTNTVSIYNVQRQARFGGTDTVGKVTIDANQMTFIDGFPICLRDNPLTANWFLFNLAGRPVFENGGTQYYSFGTTAFNLASGVDLQFNGTTVPLRNTTASRLIGRTSAGAGPAQEITLGSGLSMSGTTLNASSGLSIGQSLTLSSGTFSA